MALYNWIVFCLLVFEMTLAVGLLLPLPFTWRRGLFKFISNSPSVAKLQYGLKILFIFVGVLFVDALQNMMKLHAQGRRNFTDGIKMDVGAQNEFRSKKFLSERNMYLTGFTLFLSLILARTYSLILDLIQAQEALAKAQGGPNAVKGDSVEVEKLKLQLKELQKDYDALSTAKISSKKVD